MTDPFLIHVTARCSSGSGVVDNLHNHDIGSVVKRLFGASRQTLHIHKGEHGCVLAYFQPQSYVRTLFIM